MSQKYNPVESDDIETPQNNSSITKEVEIPMCGFLSVNYYQPYFDVDTDDIATRMTQSALFFNREKNFLGLVGDKPDAYGPVWIATTLVFVIAVASHLNGFLSSWLNGISWEYNFQSVLSASSLIYSFLFGASTVIWFILKQFIPSQVNLKFVTIFCLYGYSLLVFGPAVLICLVPSPFASWIALIAAFVMSTLFLLRNIGPLVTDVSLKSMAVLLAGVGIIQLSLMLSLKLAFFYDTSR